MSDGASSAGAVSAPSTTTSISAPANSSATKAPASGSASQSKTPTTGASSATGVAPGESPSTSDWESKKAGFFEALKSSPYKMKVKGEEIAISDEESFQKLINNAQRGVGANKLVEESKRAAEEARKEREAVAQERALFEKARRGDFEARKQLGLIPAAELEREQAEWNSVPDGVKEVLHYAQQLEKQNAEFKQRFEQEQAAQQQRQHQAAIESARRTAQDQTHQVLKALNLSNEAAVKYLPFVAGAIHDLSESGLELGVDMTPEAIIELVKERVGSFDESHFESMSPKTAMKILEAKLKVMSDDEALDTFDAQTLARLSRAWAKRIMGRRNAAQQQPQETGEISRDEEPLNGRTPKRFSPFRIGPWGSP